LRLWPFGTVNLCGVLSPRECAGVLAKALFFIGHDSGPLHLAATMQTPSVGLFGDYNRPRKWHPYGAKHRILHDMGGVGAITVPQVRDAALSIMAGL
jgi:ADP-heptose:LPS heptosyltransferase